MRGLFEVVFLSLALLGHAALWVGLVNRIHSAGMPRWGVKTLSLACLVMVPLIPLIGGWIYLSNANAAHNASQTVAGAIHDYAWWYLIPCAALSVPVLLMWAQRRSKRGLPSHVRLRSSTDLDIAKQLGFLPVEGRITRVFAAIPFNQICRLEVNEYEIELPQLVPQLDGLSIAHLSDLHFTGQITLDYFEKVIEQVNAWQPDVIAVTGDLIDEAECIGWLPKFYGRLKARHGVYFVLGNHDLRTHDVPRIRRELADAGLIDLGGRWQLDTIRGQPVLFAGNELPWICPAADMQHCPVVEGTMPLRILLSHSPDQFAWAQRWNFDLMLCGHTHGGQVCLPVIGPTLSPSWHGVEYAGGTFHQGSTTMHVSRGTSGEFPLRWNCLPELSLLVLRSRSAV